MFLHDMVTFWRISKLHAVLRVWQVNSKCNRTCFVYVILTYVHITNMFLPWFMVKTYQMGMDFSFQSCLMESKHVAHNLWNIAVICFDWQSKEFVHYVNITNKIPWWVLCVAFACKYVGFCTSLSLITLKLVDLIVSNHNYYFVYSIISM